MFFHVQHDPATGFTMDLQPGVQSRQDIDLGTAGSLHLLGDPVFGEDRKRFIDATMRSGAIELDHLYRSIRGHYYWFHTQGSTVTMGSSFGALFPLYHCIVHGHFEASSSQGFLARKGKLLQRDPRYLLERLLFNYPLFERTPWTDIRLLPAHSMIRITTEGVQISKPFSIDAHFGDGRLHARKDLEALCERFSNECRLFLPDAPFAISFTGGFDGRTLLAAARSAGRSDFFTYSFGQPGEEDVTFPQTLAKELDIPYRPILLDKDYVEQHALSSAIAFMELSEFNGNLGRPHYHHAAAVLARGTGYILTGNFGSELFRAMHRPGVMMSSSLIELFTRSTGSWKDHLAGQLPSDLRPELEGLIADIEDWFTAAPGLTANQRFYRYVLEELFRKYFGPELVMQSHFLKNRTPYLSLPFLQAMNATCWSGVHANLFEKQKVRRMKGQTFYAAFLKRTDHPLYLARTNKGYSPADVLEPWRALILAARLIAKKLTPSDPADPNSMEAFFHRHGQALEQRFRLLNDAHSPMKGNGGLEEMINLSSAYAAWAAAGDKSMRRDR